MAEVIQLDLEALGLKEEILETKVKLEIDKAEVFIEYFWNSHGTLIPWKTDKKFPKYRKSADVKVVEVKSKFGTSILECWELYIDGVKINCEVNRYSFNPYKNRVYIKASVGWG